MRDLTKRLRALETKLKPEQHSDPLWHLITDEEHEFLAALPRNPDGKWDMVAWTDEQLEAARAICLKAAGEPV